MEVAEVTWPVKLEALWDVVPLYWLLWKGHWCTHLLIWFPPFSCTHSFLYIWYFTKSFQIFYKYVRYLTERKRLFYSHYLNSLHIFFKYWKKICCISQFTDIFKKKEKQDKNVVLHIPFAPHAKLHTEKPLWFSIIGHLLGVITRIFVLYESDFWLRIIWKINKTSEWGKGKL